MSVCAQDSLFGPVSTCRSFDFTINFEQKMLSFAPDVVFAVLASLRVAYLTTQTNTLKSSGYDGLIYTKLSLLVLVFVSNAASLKWLLTAQARDVLPLWVPAPAIQFVSTVPLAFLVFAEHFRSFTPSELVISYTFLKGLFSAVALRTYVQVNLFDTARAATIASTISVMCYIFLLCVELIEKRRLLDDKSLPSVSTASFLSRFLYIWLLPLLWKGRSQVLTVDDCLDYPQELNARNTRLLFLSGLTTAQTTRHYLARASLMSFWPQLLAPVLPRLALLLATLSQPFLVSKTLGVVSDPTRPAVQGWALVGAFACVYFVVALTTSMYWEKVYGATVRFRGALVGAIYAKSLKLSSTTSRSLGGGVASTYMSVDVERICQGVEFLHEIWASVLSIMLVILILYDQASWPAFFPVIVSVLLMVVTGFIGRSIGTRQAAWLAATDRRIKFLSSIINSFLPIKWSRYEDVMAAHAAELRADEMNHARKFYASLSVSIAVSNVASTICMLSVLGPYAVLAAEHGKAPLDVNRLFTIVTTVNLLSMPLNLLGQYMPVLAASYASLKRIESFLLLEERQEDASSDLKPDNISLVGDDGRARENDVLPIISLDSASFSWMTDSAAFLKDVTVRLDERQLYMCVGPVASGKSLLLMSILGEATCTKGQYTRPDIRMAYAAQEALIVPGTIRENILFGREYQADRYASVLEACALSIDLSRLPSGDETYLGEKGRRLSGGQKQRIALARAVYADADWTLLDDPFSALDAETESHVFQSLFGASGLLKNKAVLLVTYSVQHLSLAHSIVVLDDGCVQHQGKLEEIQRQGYTLPAHISHGKGKEKENHASGESKRDDEDGVQDHRVDEGAIAETSSGFTPYLFLAGMAGWKNTGICITLMILVGAVRLGLQVYLREWSISEATQYVAWISGYAGFAFISLLVSVFCIWQYTTVLTTRSGIAIHKEEFDGLSRTSPAYFLSHSAGRIINRFSQDIFIVDYEWPLSLLSGMTLFVTLLGTLVFIFIPTPWLTLSILPLGLIYYMTMILYLNTSKQLQQLEAASKSPLYTAFSTTMSAIETIRALRVEQFFQDQTDGLLTRSQGPFYFRFSGVCFLRTLLALVEWAVAVGLAAFAVGLRHSTNASLLGLALSNLTNLSGLLSHMLMCLSNIENGSVAMSRIHEVASAPVEEDVVASASGSDPNWGFNRKLSWPMAGNIVFDNVGLRYRAELDLVLRGLSFSIPAGTKLGVCGRSGSGKSSLILAMFRGLEPSLITGTISIDGMDTKTIPLEVLRKSFSLVVQDPFVWHASIRSNLDPEGLHVDAEIWDVLEQVGMNAAVSATPKKLDTMLEDGGSFSKGQLQLLCFSRILLHKRKVVVLDEASSSLDRETDKEMRAIIRSTLKNCTVIAVAHRIETIIDFDMILVMDNGTIAESGTPTHLLANPSSLFTRLAKSQGVVTPNRL